MMIRTDKNITDDSAYGPAQVLKIDTTKMIVTMVAHRGFGPDGRAIYYIVGDSTPADPAIMMGVRDSDLVLGVSLNGETRAYPLLILVWHEIVNDKVGGAKH